MARLSITALILFLASAHAETRRTSIKTNANAVKHLLQDSESIVKQKLRYRKRILAGGDYYGEEAAQEVEDEAAYGEADEEPVYYEDAAEEQVEEVYGKGYRDGYEAAGEYYDEQVEEAYGEADEEPEYYGAAEEQAEEVYGAAGGDYYEVEEADEEPVYYDAAEEQAEEVYGKGYRDGYEAAEEYYEDQVEEQAEEVEAAYGEADEDIVYYEDAAEEQGEEVYGKGYRDGYEAAGEYYDEQVEEDAEESEEAYGDAQENEEAPYYEKVEETVYGSAFFDSQNSYSFSVTQVQVAGGTVALIAGIAHTIYRQRRLRSKVDDSNSSYHNMNV